MRRRSFLSTMGAIVGGFMILPPATTYSRIWRASAKIAFPVNFYVSTGIAQVIGLDEQMKLYADLLEPDKRAIEPKPNPIFDEGPFKCVMNRPKWEPPPARKSYEERPKTLAEILGVT